MSFDVFVSYSTKDAIAAKAACAALEAAKVRCWMAPRDIVPGAKWGASIVRAINQCRVMVLIFSGNANDSTQVQREVNQAFSKAKTVVPLRIEDVKPADELAYYLDTVHWLDALSPPLERNLEKLVATVQALLPATGPAPASDEPALHDAALHGAALDDVRAAQAQDEARAVDERRLKEAEAAQSAEAAQRGKEVVEAERKKQEAEAQPLAAERRQQEEEAKRRAEKEERPEHKDAEAKERTEQERLAQETEAKQRADDERAFAQATSVDSVASLDAFLAAYPASHLTAEARSLRAALAERERAFKDAMASDAPALLDAHTRPWLPSRRAVLVGGALLIALLGFVWVEVRAVMTEQVKSSISAEVSSLTAIYEAKSSKGLTTAIDARVGSVGALLYLLTSSVGEGLSGNVGALQPGALERPGWSEVQYKPLNNMVDDRQALVDIVLLPGGFHLLIGADLSRRDAFLRAIDVAGVGILLLVALLECVRLGLRRVRGSARRRAISGISK